MALSSAMYDREDRCILCAQPALEHKNYAKCFILLDLQHYSKNGRLTMRGRERAKELGLSLKGNEVEQKRG